MFNSCCLRHRQNKTVFQQHKPLNKWKIAQMKPANQNLFEVINDNRTRLVNLKERTCTCNRFQKDELSCSHAVVVMKEMKIDTYKYSAEDYTTKSWVQTYQETVHPVGNQDEWELPSFFEDIIILLRVGRLKSGRPKKRIIPVAWETSR